MFLLIRTHLGWLSIYWSSPHIVCLFFPGLLTSAPENPGCTGFCHFFPSLGGAFQLSRDILKLSVSFEHCCKMYYFKIRNHAIRAFKHCKSREEYVPKINAPIIVGHLPSLHQPSLYILCYIQKARRLPWGHCVQGPLTREVLRFASAELTPAHLEKFWLSNTTFFPGG